MLQLDTQCGWDSNKCMFGKGAATTAGKAINSAKFCCVAAEHWVWLRLNTCCRVCGLV